MDWETLGIVIIDIIEMKTLILVALVYKTKF